MEIKLSKDFKKNFKRLSKKYKNIKDDINRLILILEENPNFGIELGNGFHKIRLKNSDNNKGKSGGYRTITYYNYGENLILLTIYSKSEKENIIENELLEILKNYNK